MIPKGLKVGDTFKDGNMTYRVTKVVGENYESEWTGETSSKPLFVEQPKEENYSEMQYAQLKKLCAERGLDATGKKDDLVARLKG